MCRLRPAFVFAALGASLLLAPVTPAVLGAQTGSASRDLPVTGFLDAAVTGRGIRDLDFGLLTMGVASTVPVSSSRAGKWQFFNLPNNNGANHRFAVLTFTPLPTVLTGPGGATIPMDSYVARVCLEKNGADYYCYGDTGFATGAASREIAPHQRINPTGGAGQPPVAPGGDNGRSMTVYLGGTARPSATQRAGNYTATITLTFATSSS